MDLDLNEVSMVLTTATNDVTGSVSADLLLRETQPFEWKNLI